MKPDQSSLLCEFELSDSMSPDFDFSDHLDKTLRLLQEASKTAHGRSDPASRELLPRLLSLSKALTQNPRSSTARLISTLRIVRNLCAGEVSNVASFVESGGVETLRFVFKAMDFDTEVARVGVQVLANVVLTGEECRPVVWGGFFPLGFEEVSRVRSREVCDMTCRVLYAFCRESDGRLRQIRGDGVKIMAEITRATSTAGFEGDYLPWLLSKICYWESFFSQLFFEIGSTSFWENNGDLSLGDTTFTKEQTFLLSLLSRIHEQFVSNDFALSIFQILKKASAAVYSIPSYCSEPPTSSHAVEVLEYSLLILNDICAYVDPDDQRKHSPSVDSLLSVGLLTYLLGLLRDLEPPEIIRRSRSLTLNQGKAPCPYKGYRGDIVSIIANCTFRRKTVQDEIRRQNGIMLLLEQCVIDEGNPFLREKGLWAMRNLLEGNEENQSEVTELKLQGTVDTPEIAELGLRVEVDLGSGHAKLVNASVLPPGQTEAANGLPQHVMSLSPD